MVRLTSLRAAVVATACLLAAPASQATPREQTTCSGERLTFGFWNLMAGGSDAKKLLRQPGTSQARFLAGDGRELAEFQLRPNSGEARALVLVIQGNAYLGSQMALQLTALQEYPIDVVTYDYRGYGDSEGKRRFAAILEDYREIVADLATRPGYERRFIYAWSFGGIILLNLGTDLSAWDRVVLDSVPNTTGSCEPDYLPAHNFPEHCSNFLLIHGTKDNPSTELIEAARACGADLDVERPLRHAFQEPKEERRQRVEAMGAMFSDFPEPGAP